MELDEQMHNKYTSLKSLFKSTDPSKHFHGNKPKKFSTGKDQPDASKGKLVSTSNSNNAPASLSFKDRLIQHYKENLSEDTSTRIYHNAQTANYATAGIHLYGRGTNPQIKKLDNQFARREKEITGNDSVKHARTALMTDINAEHEKNYALAHQQKHHPEPVEQRLKTHKLSPTLSKFLPKKNSATTHDPQAILHKQDSLAVHHTPTVVTHAHVDTTPSHSVNQPTPVHAIRPHVGATHLKPHK